MNTRLGSEAQDGDILLGRSGFNFSGGGSTFAGGSRGSVFSDEPKAVVFNSTPASAPVVVPQSSGYVPNDAGGEGQSSLGNPDGAPSDSGDGNDGTSGVW